MVNNKKVFENEWYQNFNQKRLDHLQSLKLDLYNKKVLEVGAGVGDLTHFWISRNCDVTIHEAKSENIERLSKRYPNLDLITTDLNSGDLSRTLSSQFDIIFCYGVLYHLKNPTQTLKILSDKCSGMLLLETVVAKENGIVVKKGKHDKINEATAPDGQFCHLSREIIFATLKFFFPHIYVPLSQPNHEHFPENWTIVDKKRKTYRAVFIVSQKELANKQLIEHLPMNQTTHNLSNGDI
jgi:cyclopropane fatty-acyl-phospholipid synthase-like methyltransferase